MIGPVDCAPIRFMPKLRLMGDTPNRLRQIWAEGRPVTNGWCSIGSAFVAEAMALAGWDSVTLDCQHGLIGYSEMLAMLQAMSGAPVTPLVRVSENSPGEIMKALDAGAAGIICPLVNSRAECEAFVGACRYPPEGYRSHGPTRAGLVGGPGYARAANRDVLTFAMIETRQGLDDVEAVARTPGLDGIYIGPADLQLSLGGQPQQNSQDPDLLAAFDRILAACRAAGVRAGLYTNSPAYSKEMIGRGFDLVTVGSDLRYLNAARGEADEMRQAIDGRAQTAPRARGLPGHDGSS